MQPTFVTSLSEIVMAQKAFAVSGKLLDQIELLRQHRQSRKKIAKMLFKLSAELDTLLQGVIADECQRRKDCGSDVHRSGRAQVMQDFDAIPEPVGVYVSLYSTGPIHFSETENERSIPQLA